MKNLIVLSLITVFAMYSSTANYTSIVEQIVSSVNSKDFKHMAYQRTAYLVDTYGPRLWGSESLELAIDNVKNILESDGFENIRLEEVPNVAKWVRGKESLTLFSPRPFPTNIPMIGLGKSVGGDVTGEVVVFSSFEELESNKEKVKGKIVLLNIKWVNYGTTVSSRTQGPSIASKHGAIACLIRSVTPISIESPHTGSLSYDPKYNRIPAAAISLETADMFQRMVDRGQTIVVRLQMEAHYEGTTTSHNVIGEIVGSKFPQEIILMGGHIDSWDVGPQTGANDDAAGFMVCLHAIRTLLKLGLRPKRTIRFIAWSGEEMGEPNRGAQVYVQTHADEMKDHIIAFESDLGTRHVHGWGYTGNEMSYMVVKKINELFIAPALNITNVEYNNGEMEDTKPLRTKFGVPTMRNLVNESQDDKYYFTYHHSAGDSMNVLNPDDMDQNVVAIASLFYIIADLPGRLPNY